ncbi:MAG: Crp/Fnr family transcriptional regulator [Rhodospirillales bacterium]|nr:Crp/Fnr family transcriptional regulator [Rhodospirillales bacterium]
MDQVKGGLSGIDLFSGLEPQAVAEFEAVARWRRFEIDEQVFDKNTDTLEVYFVVEGAVRVLSYMYSDREVTLAMVPAGNYFGELAAIDQRPRSARVVAMRPSVLATIDGPTFIGLMMKYPVTALRMLERFARIIRTLDERVTELSTLSESQRIFVELVRLAQPDPRRPAGRYIPNVPNHKELASWAGTSREQVAQAIGELAREGIIERKHMNLIIRDWPRLQLLAKTG